MTIHLLKEIQRLKDLILRLSALVEDGTNRAVAAVTNRDANLAQEVIEGDKDIDNHELAIDEECLKILALYQPVAIDLRYVVACMKINNDLERVGDLACGIAKRAISMTHYDAIMPLDFSQIMSKTQQMLKMSLEALIELDADKAMKVCKMDDEVDDLNAFLIEEIRKMIQSKPENTNLYLHYFGVTRNLERIADYATNIAEDVVYMIKGEVIRHQV